MITAQDIRAKTFEKAVFGGYEMSSVDDYLEGVAQELESQAKEISVLKGKLKILADKVEEYRSTEEAMRQALVSAQQMASQIEELQKRTDALENVVKLFDYLESADNKPENLMPASAGNQPY